MSQASKLLATNEQSVRKSSLPAKPEIPSLASPITVQPERVDVSTLSPNQMLYLQRSIGNRAVQSLLASARPAMSVQHSSPPAIQPKLEVGPGNDHDEQEADRIAAEVVNQPATTQSPIQRKVEATGIVQKKSLVDTVQRNDDEEEDYKPSNKELKKEIGFGKRLGLSALYAGARVGDSARQMFPHREGDALKNRVKGRMVDTVVNARNLLYNKNAVKGLSRNDRKEVRQEQKRMAKAAKHHEHADMINF
jgi:hypothetical protein